MALKNPDYTQLAHHSLRIADPEISLPFYTEKLGMTLLAQRALSGETRYFLGFVDSGAEETQTDLGVTQRQAICCLVLVHNPDGKAVDVRRQPDSGEGYWKMAISVKDLEIARNRLIGSGVEVDSPRQVGDIAYLCHFNDPNGYCIELIQHDFLKNHRPEPENPAYRLGNRPVFLLITYRVKNAETSLKFYTETLGMRLLSVQAVEARGFTLYFLACTDEVPPHADLEHVENREWLWQRPYTMVELQHVWGTERDAEFAYRVGSETGFEGVSLATNDFDDVVRLAGSQGHDIEVCDADPFLRQRTATVIDPDGFAIRLIDKG